MRVLFLSTMIFVMTHPAAAAPKTCKEMLKEANHICQSSYLCVRDSIRVSGFDIIETGAEVICPGDKPNKELKKRKNNAKNKIHVKKRKVSF